MAREARAREIPRPPRAGPPWQDHLARARFRQKDWHARLGGGVHVDAIIDHMVRGVGRGG